MRRYAYVLGTTLEDLLKLVEDENIPLTANFECDEGSGGYFEWEVEGPEPKPRPVSPATSFLGSVIREVYEAELKRDFVVRRFMLRDTLSKQDCDKSVTFPIVTKKEE